MRRSDVTLIGLVFVAVLGVASVRAQAPSPSPPALRRLHELRPTRFGVDRHGRLWAWNRATGRTQWVSVTGELQPGPTVLNASSVDLDSEWGAAGLSGPGDLLLKVSADGTAATSAPIPNLAASICWVGSRTVAISPKLADRRVELWDLTSSLLLSTIGTEAAITPRFGAVMVRTVLLHYDFQRERLATLEAFSGDFRVFTLGGELVYQFALPVPDSERESVLNWLKQRDLEARAARSTQTPSVRYFSDFTLDMNGTAWVVGERSRARDRTTFLKIHDGVVERVPVTNGNCAAPQVTSWGGWLIQYGDVASPSMPCVEERRSP